MRVSFQATESAGTVSGILSVPEDAFCLYILAHGAGAGMEHEFMERAATALGAHGIGTLRFQFPFTEAGRRRPDHGKVLRATVCSAAQEARRLEPELPLFAGGKSMGGRMTSLAASDGDLTELRGLIFLGFPLHAAGKDSTTRAAHLPAVDRPMLFCQGTRDTLARFDLIQEVVGSLEAATLLTLTGADHSFKVLKRSGIAQESIYETMFEGVAGWAKQQLI